MRAPTWLTAPLLAAMVVGSLAVVMWFASRQPPLTATYVMSTTGSSPLYKHLIALDQTSGFADRIELQATFKTPVHVFSTWVRAPSSAHRLSCDVIPVGTKCRLGPMDGRGQYGIALTTDSGEPPVLTAAGIQLSSPADIARHDAVSSATFVLALTAVVLFGLSWAVTSRTPPRAWVLGQDDFKM